MTGKQEQNYFVHLFVVSRFETVGITAESSKTAARLARGWYRYHRGELEAGDFNLSDEVSHYLVRADGQSEESAELLEASENPLISILIDLVNWSDQAPHSKDIAQIVAEARERVRHPRLTQSAYSKSPCREVRRGLFRFHTLLEPDY